MLKISGLNKVIHGKQILNNISMDVEAGMIYGFIGHNGAGKTTTMRAITGMTVFESGEIVIDGKRYNHKTKVGTSVGFLPENPCFYDYMTGKEYLDYIAGLTGKENSKNILHKVGLSHAGHKRIETYSRGMKQRLGMGACMIHNPKLLIMDEPTSALDPAGRHELFQLILELRDRGATILLSTHILDDIEKVSDKIGIIKGGKLLKEGHVDTILSEYVHNVFDVYLDQNFENTKYIKQQSWVTEVSQKEKILSITVADVEEAKIKIMPMLLACGVVISGYKLRRPTLEDVFMNEVRL